MRVKLVSSGPALGLAWQARGAGGALAVVDACAVSLLTERSINQLKQPFPVVSCPAPPRTCEKEGLVF